MAARVRYPGPGCVVEFMQGGKPHLAFVVGEKSGRLKLLTATSREMNHKLDRLLPWAGPQLDPALSRGEILAALAERQARRDALVEGVDAMALWELAQGELPRAEVEWFAEILWQGDEAHDPDRLAALGRALLECKSHFKLIAPTFEIHPAEKVEARLQEQQAAEERERLAAEGMEFFRALWDARKKGDVPARDADARAQALTPGVRRTLESLLWRRIARPDDQETESLWKALTRGLPTLPDEQRMPLLLAQSWGLAPAHYNFLMDQSDYAPGDAWSEPHADIVEALAAAAEGTVPPASALGDDIDLTVCAERHVARMALGDEAALAPHEETFAALRERLVSVDDAATRDIDDAFAVARLPEGGFLVVVALACPACCWPWGGELDKDVFHRASSLYLPEGVSHMLPERLGVDAYSLTAQQSRPSLLLEMRLGEERGENAHGEGDAARPAHESGVLACRLRLARVTVQANMTYGEAEDAIELARSPGGAEPSNPDAQPNLRPGLDAQLDAGWELAEQLQRRRIRRGAAVIKRPEPEVLLEGEGHALRATLTLKAETPRAQLLVSEFMILVNSVLADWAAAAAVPLFHRAQDIALPKESAGVWSEPHQIYHVVRAMGPSTLQTKPARHATLGLAAYAPTSSPLRRYADLVNEAQCVHTLLHGEPLFDQTAMEAMLPALSGRLEAVGRIQRFRPRYWKLLAVKQAGDKAEWEAEVVDESPQLVTTAAPALQIFIRGPRALFGDKIIPGQRFTLRLGKVDPLSNQIHILEAWEAPESDTHQDDWAGWET